MDEIQDVQMELQDLEKDLESINNDFLKEYKEGLESLDVNFLEEFEEMCKVPSEDDGIQDDEKVVGVSDGDDACLPDGTKLPEMNDNHQRNVKIQQPNP